jgi:hypothetical protein
MKKATPPTPPEPENPITATMALLAEAKALADAEAHAAVQDVAASVADVLANAAAAVAAFEQEFPESELAQYRAFLAALNAGPLTKLTEEIKAKVADVVFVRSGLRPQFTRIQADVKGVQPATLYLPTFLSQIEERCRKVCDAPGAARRLREETDALCTRLNARGLAGLTPLPSVVAPPEQLPAASTHVVSNFVPGGVR